MIRAIKKFIILSIIAFCSASCSTLYSVPEVYSNPVGQEKFPGIIQLLGQQSNNEKETQKELDVLMVHGMCTHDMVWANQAVANLATALGSDANKLKQISFEEVQDSKAKLFRATILIPEGKVNVRAIVWSPVVADLKRKLCYDRHQKSELCSGMEDGSPKNIYLQRASLNEEIKDQLLNDCLSDALIYQGKAKNEIVKQIQNAILAAVAIPKIFSGNAHSSVNWQPNKIVFISESLGSKLVYDAINSMKKNDTADKESAAKASAAQAISERIIQVFMGANQLPLLALADHDLNGKRFLNNYSQRGNDNIGALGALDTFILGRRSSLSEYSLSKNLSHKNKSVDPLRIVAFTDPNDLLSYPLIPTLYVEPKDNYIANDVIVSNAPTYFGFVENPLSAHLGYRQNNIVSRMVACGRSVLCHEN